MCRTTLFGEVWSTCTIIMVSQPLPANCGGDRDRDGPYSARHLEWASSLYRPSMGEIAVFHSRCVRRCLALRNTRGIGPCAAALDWKRVPSSCAASASGHCGRTGRQQNETQVADRRLGVPAGHSALRGRRRWPAHGAGVVVTATVAARVKLLKFVCTLAPARPARWRLPCCQ